MLEGWNLHQSHPGDLYVYFKATSGFVYVGLLFKKLNFSLDGLLYQKQHLSILKTEVTREL